MQRNRLGEKGFTLAEFLVVLALIAVVAALGFPVLQNVIYRAKVRGEIRKATGVLQVARLEAIRRGAPAVVQIDPDTNEMIGFVDIHGVNATDPSDGLFNPVAAPYRNTDYEVRRITVAAGMVFADPDGNTGFDSIDGFDNAVPLPDEVVIFQPDGSVNAAGAFRFADRRANYLEIRIAPAATGKIQIRKYDESLAANWDGTNWYAEGEVSRSWSWN